MVLRSEILVNKNELPTAQQALPGRDTPISVPSEHFVNGNPLVGPFPQGMQTAIFGMGCFWGRNAVSGSNRACGARPSAMPVAAPRTRPMKKPARA